MDIDTIRASFALLGFEKPTKNETDVKSRYRSLVLEHSPDRTSDETEKLVRTEKVRALHEAKTVCMAFCASPLSEEEIEASGQLDEEEAHRQYLQMLELFLGRVIQRRFRFWARISLAGPTAQPEFDEDVFKRPLVNTKQALFQILASENGREEVRWVLGFEVREDPSLAWVVLEMIDQTTQAVVFFSKAPGKTKVLSEITHTALTAQAVSQLLAAQGLRKLRGVRGSEFWGEYPEDPWQIQVHGGGAALCWMTLIEGNLTHIAFYRASSAEELAEVFPRWIERVKAETWEGPL